RHHDAKHRAQESDVWGICRDSPDDHQPFGQCDFKCSHVGELREVYASIVEPAFHGDGHRPHTQRKQQSDNAILYRILEHIHSSILHQSLLMHGGPARLRQCLLYLYRVHGIEAYPLCDPGSAGDSGEWGNKTVWVATTRSAMAVP